MKKGPVTPKGFKDISPAFAKKRRVLINEIAAVLENFGFQPLETPIVEFAETLKGKYGEDEKLIYQFEDKGGRMLALRFDLTVPLSRYIANNLGVLNPTFSRYQIGEVFRGENPQKGRYRQFTQFDFDIVGSADISSDAKIIAAALASMRKAGFKNALMRINDRENFIGFKPEVIRAIDKIWKIGKEKAIKDAVDNGASKKDALIIENIARTTINKNLAKLFNLLKSDYSLNEGDDFVFDPTLARGLDYYTGFIFELKPDKNPETLSIGGGGRYDNLIGIFAKRNIPAVGFSYGIDRITELI